MQFTYHLEALLFCEVISGVIAHILKAINCSEMQRTLEMRLIVAHATLLKFSWKFRNL